MYHPLGTQSCPGEGGVGDEMIIITVLGVLPKLFHNRGVSLLTGIAQWDIFVLSSRQDAEIMSLFKDFKLHPQ